MSSPIEDYAMIGDCETAALVAKNGSIDWLCFPRFDSGACFAALLGTPENGRWLITPTEKLRSIKRRYRPGTLILETDYETESGAVTIIDWMPPRSGEVDVMRMVVGRRGQVPMRMDLTIRFDYGWIVPWVRRIERGILAIAGPDTLYCRTDVELHGENMHTVADFLVSEGQRIPFELVWCPTYRKTVPTEKDVEANLHETEDWWKNWSDRCSYRGEWGDAVLRSLITLKALTYSQTGGIVSAPTTSLPEKLGGVRNWDYRFCWLRDATFTLHALMVGGYMEALAAWERADGATEDLGVEVVRWNIFTSTRVSSAVTVWGELEFEDGGEEVTLELAQVDLRIQEWLQLRGGVLAYYGQRK